MIRVILFILAFFLFTVNGFSQPAAFRVEAVNQPLNMVLVSLRTQYGFHLSYSDSKLSKYAITASGSFDSEKDLLLNLLDGLPFTLKTIGNVHIIVPVKEMKKVTSPIKITRISGQIMEEGSLEPLPFSHVIINNTAIVSDATGRFNYTSTADTTYHLRISHLGYYIFDTTLYSGIDQVFRLIPSYEKLPEIVVQNNLIEKATLMGDRPGKIHLNHNIARVLPGQGDNSVFNLIRLMPGVLASGEQATDLLIWGSYEGQSQVTFDGFTLFGLKNYNDNISVINPFLVKNIEIFKGGFDARYGNRVGGLVNITGKNGNFQKPVFSLNINPTTVNAMLEIPSFQNSSLLVAYRQTYYNLYSSTDFNVFAPTRTMGKGKSSAGKNAISFDFDVFPEDYAFQDFNMKYTATTDGEDQFFVSLYGGGDRFVISADTEIERMGRGQGGRWEKTPYDAIFLNKEYNQQLCGSLFYNRNWQNGNSSLITISHSGFSKRVSDEMETENLVSGEILYFDRASMVNKANENQIRNENTFHFLGGHKLEAGGSLSFNDATLSNILNARDSTRKDTTNYFENSRLTLFVQDHLPLGEKINFKSGMRINYLLEGKQLRLEPRLSLSYKPMPELTLNTSWGIYNQFMYKIASVDKDLNYSWVWLISGERLPVLIASHFTIGGNYFKNDLTVNIEGYFKPLKNLTRRVYESRFRNNQWVDGYYFYYGDARAYGLDAFVKKDFGKHSVWASYSLSWSEERLSSPGTKLPDFAPAPHDQRHELKLAGIYNLKNFYLSANYVYGSGMELLKQVFSDEAGAIFYSRLDAALTYRFYPWGKATEIGVSVLNLLDTQNLKHANIKNINISREIGSVSVYTNSVPFTPTISLKIVL